MDKLMMSAFKPSGNKKTTRPNQRNLLLSDDNSMMHEVHATHAPNGFPVNVDFILRVAEGILDRVFPGIDRVKNGSHHPENMVDEKDAASNFGENDGDLAYVIQQVSTELWYKHSGENVHKTTLAILNKLSSYTWFAKAAISTASFAINYGEFWLVALLFETNPLAKSVAYLKQVSEIIDQSSSLKPHFDTVNELVKAALDLRKCICEFRGLPQEYISDDKPPKSTALSYIPTAVYWIIRSLIASGSHVTRLLGIDHETMALAAQTWELSSLGNKLSSIHEDLKTQLALCYQHIDERKHEDYFHKLVRLFETTPHIDNQKILTHLIYLKDDLLPLEIGTPKIKAGVEVLRGKTVLLLISDFDISDEEVFLLDRVHQEARKLHVQYEIVWLPIVDRSIPFSEVHDLKFRHLQSNMPWYTLHHPSLLHPAVTRYIKEMWRYVKKPILVALDPQGKVVSQNAFHPIYIWGSVAYPFTSSKEDELWRNEAWTLPFLIDEVDRLILDWINDDKYICLYGGDDIEWIHKFTTTAKEVAMTADIGLEMVYVGENGNRAKVNKMNKIISERHYSRCWDHDVKSVWYFWTRLESMMHSKVHRGRTIHDDQIIREVLTLLTYGSSDKWALIGRGSSTLIARARGDMFLTGLEEFTSWQGEAKEKGFIPALIDYFDRRHTPEHCNRLIFPGVDGDIPETVICTECHRPMEKYYLFRCCTD